MLCKSIAVSLNVEVKIVVVKIMVVLGVVVVGVVLEYCTGVSCCVTVLLYCCSSRCGVGQL